MDMLRPPLQSAPPDEGDSVNGIAARIYRRRGLFAIVFGLAFLPSLMAVAMWPAIYFASGTVIVGEQEPTSSAASPAWIQKLGDPADVESQLLIIGSHRMLRLALSRPGVIDAVLRECRSQRGLVGLLRRGPGCDELEPGSRQLREHAEARYSARAVGRSRIIAIGYESPLPDVAFMMANALLLTYLEDQRAENARGREASATWLLKEAERLDPASAAETHGREGSSSEAAANQSRQKFLTDVYNKARDLETERRTLLSGTRLVSLAEVPKSPSFPKKTPLLAAGLTLAFILGGLAALYRDTRDYSLRRPRDLERLTKSAVLASLPHLQPSATGAATIRSRRVLVLTAALWSRGIRNRPWVAVDKSGNKTTELAALLGFGAANHVVAKEIRNLLARLLLLGVRRILLVSTTRDEGKSFTALSLARFAAASGRKVLLVDCNFRRPVIAQTLGVSAETGLATILRGEVEQSRAISPTTIPGLDILAAGADCIGSRLLLIDGDLAAVMRQTESYDLVLLDGPSTDCSLDARILARHVDGILVCARWKSALPAQVKNLIDGMSKERVNVLGLVVTMVNLSELRWYERTGDRG